MIGLRQRRPMAFVAESPLRPADPRAKLVLAISLSLAVMLPLRLLVPAIGAYLLFLAWARLLSGTLRQMWQLKWLLLFLFLIDWWLVSLELAVVIVLRVGLLATTFTVLFSTTTLEELQQALEWAGVPYRYAFSLSLAFHSLTLLGQEWQTILEAQQARGAWAPPAGWHGLFRQAGQMVALVVPAIVLTTKRAWAITEAAYARGFDSPHRRPFRELAFARRDGVIVALSVLTGLAFVLSRWLLA